MSLTTLQITAAVQPEGEETVTQYELRATNGDLIAWELTASRKGWQVQTSPFLMQTWLAWHILKRQGFQPGTFEDFQQVCLATTSEAVPVDPTQQAAGAA